MLFADVVMLVFALWASFSMRLGQLYLPAETVSLLFVAAPIIAVPIFIRLGLYRAIVRYIGFKALWTIIKAVSFYAVIWSALAFISGAVGVPTKPPCGAQPPLCSKPDNQAAKAASTAA